MVGVCKLNIRAHRRLASVILLFALSLPCAATAATTPHKTSLVSLAPSNTELIYSLGGEESLVGVSTFCKYPPAAEKKPKAGSFVSIDFEKMARLKPDIVVLAQGQEPLSIQLKKHGIKSLVLRNKTLADIANNLITLGSLCGRKEQAETLAAAYKTSLDKLKNIVKNEAAPPTLLCVWPKPIVTIGGDSFLNDVVIACGAKNASASLQTSYPKLSAERLIAYQPEVVVLPYQAEGTSLHTKPPWSLLSAIKNKRFFYLPDPDDDFLSRPTLRIVNGLCWLASHIHPKLEAPLKQWLSDSSTRLHIAN